MERSQHSKDVQIWLPPLHEKQKFAFNSIATEILYGGATRGGKSYFARNMLIKWCTLIPNLITDIFRLTFDDVIGNNMQGENSFPDLLANWEKERLVSITRTQIKFNFNGSIISLEHCGSDEVLSKHQGIETHIRVFEEATQIKEKRIRWLRSWVSMNENKRNELPSHIGYMYPELTDEDVKQLFPKVLYTANPIGESAGFFRREFVKARPKYKIEHVGAFLRQYIPAKVEDNPSENAELVRARVADIGDEATADALLNENWDAPVGDFFRTYNDDVHSVDDFIPPIHWFKFRTFDWGSAEPFSVLWWCVSDGEEFESQSFNQETGRYEVETRWFPRGALIAYREWHGCDSKDPSKGIDITNKEIAEGIKARTLEGNPMGWATYTDSLPFQERGASLNDKKYKMCDEFKDLGVPLTRANTARAYGCAQIKSRLKGTDGYALIYFCKSCIYVRDYLPSIQRDPLNPEVCVDKGEASHSVDIVRYAATLKPLVIDKKPEPNTLEIKPPTSAPTVNMIIRKIQQKNQRQARY